MCAIAGLFGFHAGLNTSIVLQAMTDALRHRGPDDQGHWQDQDAGIALGHRRLAIIDLSASGHQPMHSACGRYVCVFNGEIYNHQALRAGIDRTTPHTWRGHSDTETLLAGFALWGIDATLHKTVGMFAIALWDKQERQLHLIRDRMGEKPLYYGQIAGQFAFASELKALRCLPGFSPAIDRNALTSYMRFGYIPAPASIYQAIHKLEPGQRLIVSRTGAGAPHLTRLSWWSMADAARRNHVQPFTCQTAALAALEQQLLESVRLQAQADVPLGAFLSGGIDSSLIVALMQATSPRPVRTFTVGFEQPGYNEAEHARVIARHLGTEHTEFRLGVQEAQQVIPLLPQLYDEPFADTSQIPTYLVCQQARRQVTVALSGDAGDELFGGYSLYLWTRRLWKHLGWLPAPLRNGMAHTLTKLPATVRNRLNLSGQKSEQLHKLGDGLRDTHRIEDLFYRLSSHWQTPEQLVLNGRETDGHWQSGLLHATDMPMEQRMMLIDSLTEMTDDILCKVDRAAMGNSLETRIPLLDHRLFELAWRLPPDMKIRHGQGKWALRQVLYKYVPAELIDRPKQGFNVPISHWLRGELRPWAEALLDESRLRQQGFLNSALVRQEWSNFLVGKGRQQRLWNVLMFQAWLEHQASP